MKKTNRDKSDLSCYTCGETGHFSKDYSERADRRGKKAKTINVVTASNTDGYGRSGFIRPNGEWITCFCSWCWHSGSEVYFWKDRAAEERATCPSYEQESR